MKKQSFICAILCCAILLSAMFTGCSDNAFSPSSFSADNSANHISNISETSDYVIKGNKTDYKIVVPENASLTIKEAAKELTQLTNESTGAVLETVSENVAAVGGKYISLGKTSLAASAGISYDGLGTDGYIIKTVGESVYVYGEDYGTLYGVYGLLNDWAGYEFFYKNAYSLEKKSDVKLKNYDVKEVPDIAYRAAGYGTMWQETQTTNRFRMRSYPSFFVPIRGQIFHNAFAYLPYEENAVLHPKWYNSGADQICYTAHGDKSEYDKMVKETVRVLKEELAGSPDKNMVTFSILDNGNSCVCEECNRLTAKYGAESAAIILFLNDVNADIKEWFAAEGAEYKRDLKICFFAYNKYVKPPVKFNSSTGKYEPVDGIKCDDGVCALIAPLEADYTVDFDSRENESTKSVLLGWNAVSRDISTWFYDTLFVSTNVHYVFYNSFNGYQERMRYAYSVGSFWIFNQGQDQVYGGMSGFDSFKMYLSSRLSWNVNENYHELKQKFFDNFYGAASGTMTELFDEMSARALYFKEKLNAGGDCYASWDKPEYWTKGALTRWHGYLDKAFEEILPIKDTDGELYERLSAHISYERLGINFLLCTLWSGSLSEEDYEKYRAEFKTDAERSGNTDALKSGLVK